MRLPIRVTRTALVAAIALSAVLTGCSSSKPVAAPTSSGPSGSITVFAASSLTGAFTTLGKDYQAAHPGTKVTFDFDSSATLATQIDQGAPADVFASAAPGNMKTVIAAGYAAASTNFVSNSMEIVVPPSNPAGVASIADLAKPAVKVVLCVATAPCGVTAAAAFAKAGITVKPVTTAKDVKTTLADVELGEADAGVVYITDVLSAGDKVKGIPIAPAQNASTEYPIAALTHSTDSTLAAAFVAYVESSAGRSVLTAAGFARP